MSTTLIDGIWFFGGNRERGIGRYLDEYFVHHCAIKKQNRLWLVPAQAPDKLINDLVARYGGKTITLDMSMSGPRQQELILRQMEERQIDSILVSSPFERPWSLLDWQPFFAQWQLKITTIVFDLLPQQYPAQILHTWPLEDQKKYRQRLWCLRQVDQLLAISRYTQQQLQKYLNKKRQEIKVIPFGEKVGWIQPPPSVNLQWWREVRTGKYALTISGGEWRKNLAGTLQYFANNLATEGFTLLVICRLSWMEKIHLHWLAWRLGIYGQVKWLGYVGEREKWRWLAQSDVFLFLSLAEGLGIPVLEAVQAQIPRIIISEELANAGFDQFDDQIEVAEYEQYHLNTKTL